MAFSGEKSERFPHIIMLSLLCNKARGRGGNPIISGFCCEGGDPYSGKEAPTPHMFEMFEAKGIAKPLFNQYLFIYLS